MVHLLTPQPRSIQWHETTYTLPPQGSISQPAPSMERATLSLQAALNAIDRHYNVAHSGGVIHLSHDAALPAQGYTLRIDADGVHIRAGDDAGLFYGVCTLNQIIAQAADGVLPGVEISDWPDYPQRGFMLDISRDRVPTLQTLFHLIDTLAALKYNQLQLYTEHTFAYPEHEIVWQHASPLTAEEIRQLDDYCHARFIELVPNQNSLGHMERWLKHPPYRPFAYSPDGFIDYAGKWRDSSTLHPTDSAALDFMTSLYDTLLPNFRSKQVNVGCDEPWELDRADDPQAGHLYLEWVLNLHKYLSARGYTMMFWGDIIIKHPALVPRLPHDVIVMEWGYEATHPFDANCEKYAQAGIPFYVCPGTSSWNALAGRVKNTADNIRVAAEAGLKHGASGILVTDWGDNGHWQPLPASYAGIVYGAGAGWCLEQNRDPNLTAALDTFVYHDAAQVMGSVSVALGSIYQEVGPEHINGQLLAYALQWKPEDFNAHLERMYAWGRDSGDISPENLRRVIGLLDRYAAQLDGAQMQRDDAEILTAEWRHVAALLKHGARWMLLLQGEADADKNALLQELEELVAQQRTLWLARSREGGLADSLRRFDTLRQAYQAG